DSERRNKGAVTVCNCLRTETSFDRLPTIQVRRSQDADVAAPSLRRRDSETAEGSCQHVDFIQGLTEAGSVSRGPCTGATPVEVTLCRTARQLHTVVRQQLRADTARRS